MKYAIFTLLVGILLTSCEQAFFIEEPGKEPKDIFEQTWHFADREYSFFEYKNIDWDSVYNYYEPRITNDLSEQDLFNELADMLFCLRDGHVNLSSSFNRSRNWDWYLEAPDNFDKYLLERNYFKNKQQLAGPFVVYDFGDVGYIYYESFSSSWSDETMEQIADQFKDKKGLIIDIRSNFGGLLSNVHKIGSYLVKNKVTVAKSRDKNGSAHDDFTEFNNFEFEPDDNIHFDMPVVLLTNRKSYSASNFLATSLSALPQVTIMGDATGGGGGAPSFTELSNGWNLRVSNTQLFTIDGINTENGMQPDIKVDITDADLAAGIDTILETALSKLRE